VGIAQGPRKADLQPICVTRRYDAPRSSDLPARGSPTSIDESHGHDYEPPSVHRPGRGAPAAHAPVPAHEEEGHAGTPADTAV